MSGISGLDEEQPANRRAGGRGVLAGLESLRNGDQKPT